MYDHLSVGSLFLLFSTNLNCSKLFNSISEWNIILYIIRAYGFDINNVHKMNEKNLPTYLYTHYNIIEIKTGRVQSNWLAISTHQPIFLYLWRASDYHYYNLQICPVMYTDVMIIKQILISLGFSITYSYHLPLLSIDQSLRQWRDYIKWLQINQF